MSKNKHHCTECDKEIEELKEIIGIHERSTEDYTLRLKRSYNTLELAREALDHAEKTCGSTVDRSYYYKVLKTLNKTLGKAYCRGMEFSTSPEVLKEK